MELIRRFLNGGKTIMDKRDITTDERLCELLKTNTDSFDPFFTTRVMARVYMLTAEQEAWVTNLWKMFRRVAATAALFMGILVAHNIAVQWEYRTDSNAVEMIMGIPPATLSTTIQLVGLWL
jgi:hypothetical protein